MLECLWGNEPRHQYTSFTHSWCISVYISTCRILDISIYILITISGIWMTRTAVYSIGFPWSVSPLLWIFVAILKDTKQPHHQYQQLPVFLIIRRLETDWQLRCKRRTQTVAINWTKIFELDSYLGLRWCCHRGWDKFACVQRPGSDQCCVRPGQRGTGPYHGHHPPPKPITADWPFTFSLMCANGLYCGAGYSWQFAPDHYFYKTQHFSIIIWVYNYFNAVRAYISPSYVPGNPQNIFCSKYFCFWFCQCNSVPHIQWLLQGGAAEHTNNIYSS